MVSIPPPNELMENMCSRGDTIRLILFGWLTSLYASELLVTGDGKCTRMHV